MGILLFELFVGYPPFEGDGAMDLYAKIVSADVKYPKKITPHAQALLRMLLHPSQTERLGSLKGGAEDVKQYAHQKHPLAHLRLCSPPRAGGVYLLLLTCT